LKWTVTEGVLSIEPAQSAPNHWEAMTFTCCEVEPFAWAESALQDDFLLPLRGGKSHKNAGNTILNE